MALGMHVIVPLLCGVVLTTASDLCNDACVSKRFDEFEKRLSSYEAEVHYLRRTDVDQQSLIHNQQRQIQQIREELHSDRQMRVKQSLVLDEIRRENRQIRRMCLSKTPVNNLEDEHEKKNGQPGVNIRNVPVGEPSLKIQEHTGIAFSVFLDHSIETADQQTVRFNQIITNEGNGYSIDTGIFTCMEDGVYFFTFIIGETAGETGYAGVGNRLVVNSVNIINSVVEAYHTGQDLQGGNTAILRLKARDVVWVNSSGGHISGSSTSRLTSFSGFFLYS